jgi:hypothetical protein
VNYPQINGEKAFEGSPGTMLVSPHKIVFAKGATMVTNPQTALM